MVKNNHISKETLLAFKQDQLNPQELEQFLEHICTCNFCSEQLADCMLEEMVAAPQDMKANILKTVKTPEVQIIRSAKETSKRIQLLLYSLKVGTATAGALIVLLLVMNFNHINSVPDYQVDPPKNSSTKDENTFSLTSAIRDNMDTLNNSMLDFSNTIMKTEVIDNDKKEK